MSQHIGKLLSRKVFGKALLNNGFISRLTSKKIITPKPDNLKVYIDAEVYIKPTNFKNLWEDVDELQPIQRYINTAHLDVLPKYPYEIKLDKTYTGC